MQQQHFYYYQGSSSSSVLQSTSSGSGSFIYTPVNIIDKSYYHKTNPTNKQRKLTFEGDIVEVGQHVVFYPNEVLGKGSYATVYKGYDSELKEDVAVKVVDKQVFIDDPDLEKCFKEEIRIMSQVNSPHVIKIFKCLQQGSKFFMIMEYCPNGDLKQLLKKNPDGFSQERATNIIRQVLIALRELQLNLLVHRDIKPANVLIGKNDTIKLGDFGCAINVNCIEEYSTARFQSYTGTPIYMSPQIMSDKRYTSKTDIWSLGLLYYELLNGSIPQFKNINQLRKFMENQPQDVLPLVYPSKNISSKIKNFIAGCLKIEEHDRYGWDQLYYNELWEQDIGKHNCKYDCKQQKIDRKSSKLIRELQQEAEESGSKDRIVPMIFDKYDEDKTGFISRPQFKVFIQKYDKKITQIESDRIFNVLDQNKQQQLDYAKFFNLFEKSTFEGIDQFVECQCPIF